MNRLIEFKSISGQIKDVDLKNRIVTGYLAGFGNKDFDNDIIEKGSFVKTLAERKNQIFFLNQHQWKEPHGKFSLLKEDQKGLYFESKPFVEGVSYSDDVLKLYDAGIINEHSIGYNTIKSDYDSETQIRTIREIKLYEGSNVTLGANDQTPFTGMKGLTISELNDKCSLLYKAIRNGDFRDETFSILEYALKDMQRQAFELGKALTEPLLSNTQKEPQIINEYIKTLQT